MGMGMDWFGPAVVFALALLFVLDDEIGISDWLNDILTPEVCIDIPHHPIICVK